MNYEVKMNRIELDTWVRNLKLMEKKHLVELDHKDCGELADVIVSLMVEIDGLRGRVIKLKQGEKV